MEDNHKSEAAKVNRAVRLGLITAIITFAIQAFIMLMFYLTMSDIWMTAGVFLCPVVAIANLVILPFVLPVKGLARQNLWKLQSTIGAMLLNIPVAIYCFWTSSILLDTVRVTFSNPYSTPVTDLEISGCEQHWIATLPPGGRKTVWVAISSDCSIQLQYHHDGEVHQESVVGYCTSSMGMAFWHELGKGSDQWFE